jgi:hypothetical protein
MMALRGRGQILLVLVAGGVLGASFMFGLSAAQSPDNCGELPGITRGVAMLLAIVLAVALAIGGAVAALATRSWAPLVACLLIGLSAPIGVGLGQRMVTASPCDSSPHPVQVPAAIEVRFTAPYPGAQPNGPAECRSDAGGRPVDQIVSQGGHAEFLTDWRFGDPNDKFVDLSIWPVTPGPEAPAHHLRINLYRLPGQGTPEASADYTDSGSATIQVDTNVDGNTGSIVFTDLPAGNVHGAGLPQSISGRITWSCAASEPTP